MNTLRLLFAPALFAPALVALSLVALSACSGTSAEPSTDTANALSPPVTVQADQASNPLTADDSAAGDVSGHWYCAASEVAGNADNWSKAFTLEFLADRTLSSSGQGVSGQGVSGQGISGQSVSGQSMVNRSGTWWYTPAGAMVQWANGDTTEYRVTDGSLGGLSDGSTHCLRELPSAGSSVDAPALAAIPTYDCGNGTIVGFAANGRLFQNGVVSGQWRMYLGNGIGIPTPDAQIGYTYIEFNDTRFTVIDDTLLQEFGEWSCFSIKADGPLLTLLAPLP